jgi:two-component system, NarL family, nitrate/nitrite response regulator NarL
MDDCEGAMLNLKPAEPGDTSRFDNSTKGNLILCSGNRLFREGLRRILTSTKTTIVAEVRTLTEAHDLMCSGEVKAGLMVCDADENFSDDFESLKSITDRFPKIGIVVLADQMSQRDLDLAMMGGARGFLPKDISPEALQISLALVVLGEDIFTAPASLKGPGMPSRTAQPVGQGLGNLRSPLSVRESQILQCLENGLPNKTIARDLDMAEATVKVHLKALLRKINVENRTQAAIWSMNNMHMPTDASGNRTGKSENVLSYDVLASET